MSKMSGMTPLYDLAKSLPLGVQQKYLNGQRPADPNAPDQVLRFEQAQADLQVAIESLKTTPNQEDKGTMIRLIYSMLRLSATALDYSDNDQARANTKEGDPEPEPVPNPGYPHRAAALASLQSLFQEFAQIYQNQYSEAAIAELTRNGKPVPSDEVLKEKLELLRQFNDFAAQNLDADNAEAALAEARNSAIGLLNELNPNTHADLFGPMASALYQYRRENMGNFARWLEHLGANTVKTAQNQSMHADYLQGWERLGYVMGNLVVALGDLAVYSTAGALLGAKMPLHVPEDNNGRPSNAADRAGRNAYLAQAAAAAPRPRSAPAA